VHEERADVRGQRPHATCDACGAEAEHDDGLEPHIAIGVRDPDDRGDAVRSEERLELPQARRQPGRQDDRVTSGGVQPITAARTRTSSAVMLTASSAGVSAPMATPIGE